jgi:hypothetical protein
MYIELPEFSWGIDTNKSIYLLYDWQVLVSNNMVLENFHNNLNFCSFQRFLASEKNPVQVS